MKALLVIALILAALFGGLALYRQFFGPLLKPTDGPGMASDWRSRVDGLWITEEPGQEECRVVLANDGSMKLYDGELLIFDGPYSCDAERFRLWPVVEANAVKGSDPIPYEVFIYTESDQTASEDTMTGWLTDPDKHAGDNTSALFVRGD